MAYSHEFYDPKLKSSPVPILFIPFKKNEEKCNYCGIEYSKTLKFEQKYCKNCLFLYIKYMGNNTCLDTYISTNNTQCVEHKATRNSFCTINIQEWCEYCSAISLFTHLIPNTSSLNNYSISQSMYDSATNYEWRLFYLTEYGQKHYYQISSEWIELILTKKSIQVLYLSWWDNFDKCMFCLQELKYIHQESVSNCQKWCQKCQSQCKNCERISFINIDITNVSSENCIMDEFILTFTRNDTDSNSLRFIRYLYSKMVKYLIERIPYSQFKDLRKIGEGGFSIIYKATWSDDGTRNIDVALKKLFNSQNISKYFFNELKALSRCNYATFGIIGFHGITQDPITEEYILIMKYANSGNLHNYLQNNFINITWTRKLRILKDISEGLKYIHGNNFMHRDFHSGNILSSIQSWLARDRRSILQDWLIGDFGLSQPANSTSPNNEIYGVIPYIAPEIFKGAAFSQKSDIYSFGMIMWELTTGCKPFASVEHDHNLIFKILDGERPKITEDTPECYADLMKKCWDSNPSKRPTIDKICNTILDWTWTAMINLQFETIMEFERAEKKRLKLIQLKKLGPGFSEKPHPNAIYTSRALSSLISKSSTIDFSSINSVSAKQEYITKEYELDINKVQSSSTQNINSGQVPNLQHQNVSGPLNYLTANSSRKRNNEELNIETQNSKKIRKNINTDDSDKELY
ncbi:kinase-like domain-containing protein [Rhizophagus irregularis DAOM 181602=DAOM 197198]|nr:kinase-like domain-containing protein [Rhizophagus irregularis DAOM 181602=DAOM 197198]